MGMVQIGRGNKKEWVRDGLGTPFETNPVGEISPCGKCRKYQGWKKPKEERRAWVETSKGMFKPKYFGFEGCSCEVYPDGIPRKIGHIMSDCDMTYEQTQTICPHFERGAPQQRKPL